MMSCNNKDGIFPLTKEECEIIDNLCSERVAEMKVKLNEADSHLFYKIAMIEAKMKSYVMIMNSKIPEKNCVQTEQSN